MPIIDQKFVDVDFAAQGFTTGDNGELPSGRTELFGDHFRVMKRADLEAVFRDPSYTGCENLISRIYNQNGDPSCVSNATCQAHEVRQAQQYGKDKVIPLSQLALYKRVGSARSGSSIGSNLEEMLERGSLPLDTPENRARFTYVGPEAHYNSYQLPAGWEQTAKQFRFSEYFKINDDDEFYTALALCLPVIYARSGHSILAVRGVIDSSRWLRKYVNSWGNWGSAGGEFSSGFGFDSDRAGGFTYAIAVRSVIVTDIQGPPSP